MMDVIVEYYFESGILEGGDDNDYVDIDLQAVAEFVCSKAKEDGRGEYSADEVLFVAQATWIFRKRILTEVCISTQV